MRISDWSSDVCSSDLAIETIDRGNGIVLQTGQGPMMVRRDRLIRTMDDSELEDFCRRWVSGRSGYFEVKRFGQAGDMGRDVVGFCAPQRHEGNWRSEEHTSELQSLMRISYAVFCLKKKKNRKNKTNNRYK